MTASKPSNRNSVVTPRPYLSYSSYRLFRSSRQEWIRTYVMGQARQFPGTKFGSDFAKARELGEKMGDPDADFAMTFMPKYPKREFQMSAILTWTAGPQPCEILGKFDGYDPKKRIIADDKTTYSTKGKAHVWTQREVDGLEQLTWYAYIYWKKFGKIPDLHLNWYNRNTQQVKTFATRRTVADFIMLNVEIRKTWEGILETCEEAYAAII